MSDYKRLERKLVYKGAIIDVYCDDIQIPDGRVRQWDFIDHKGAAAMLPVDNDGNIIMVRQTLKIKDTKDEEKNLFQNNGGLK